MKTVHIYYIADFSVKTRGKANAQIQESIIRTKRALDFCPYKTKLHIIGYRDKAFLPHPLERVNAYGNPNLAEGFKMLANMLEHEKEYGTIKARTIFIWHTSGSVLEGWQKALEKLYKNREFAFGLRYVIQHGEADKYAKEAFYRFTETSERILHYFSESRLCSLIESISKSKY